MDRQNPFLATIRERYRLNQAGSQKQTYHITLDMKGSGIHYKVGDSVGIIPRHDPVLVNRTLDSLRLSGNEQIVDKRSGVSRSLKEHFAGYANITRLNQALILALNEKLKSSFLNELLSNRETLANYLQEHELWDLLSNYPEASWEAQEIVNLLPPVLPRFYSIASSKHVVGEEVHLTVAMTEFTTNQIVRHGVGSHFLCHLAPLDVACVPTYLHPSNGFTLPANHDVPIIMVGPGTGIAPFRGFMQERLAMDAAGKNWLFFGERHRAHDFLYQEFWNELTLQGKLKLECAFSRDQSNKVYVQHKMLENAKELWQWLEEGAYLYVCGDAGRMAKDVDQALHQIISTYGNLSEESTKFYLKQLKLNKRYLRDVY